MFSTSLYLLIMWLCGWFMLWNIRTLSSRGPQEPHSVSVIIPARNEEANLKKLLPTLSNQSMKLHEVIVVNDDSEDRTEEVAREFGVTVVKPERLPIGWLGKPWACWNGAKQATGSLLLFLDADLEIERDGIERLCGEWERKRGLISVQPFHHMKSVSEKFSSLFNIIVMAAMQCFTLFRTKPAGAFGPCLMIDRKTYTEIGGHEGIRHQVLEHMEMGRVAMNQDVNVTCFSGYKTVYFRMYAEGLTALFLGWCKSFALGSAKTPLMPLLLTVAWITGGISLAIQLPFLFVQESNEVLIWGIFYLLYAVQIKILMKKIGTNTIVSALSHPLQFMFFSVVYIWSFILSMIKKEVKWKGREISVSEKGDA
ncbi:glycosyltransferase family 2 protein [Fictibacillus nanhaiensis]|uniref:glycosyltransferase n=1 Tax=Fictibacillus nanhaiensis TaxID=742169 RepID=UPI002E1F1B75|nr:glycosyltransferase family 2 protein [Fictibacillus nanhaiensis]